MKRCFYTMCGNTMLYAIVLLAADTTRALECYRCGSMYEQEQDIPVDTYCHDMFDPTDWQQVWPHGWAFFPSGQYYEIRNGVLHYYQSNMTKCEGHYDPGEQHYCYKRFLDVGDNFVQRGCHKEMNYQTGENKFIDKTSISWKFLRMQMILAGRMEQRGETSACLTSPTQILTKFNMDVTMPVHYHVCLCATNYCNGGERLETGYWILCFVMVVFR